MRSRALIGGTVLGLILYALFVVLGLSWALASEDSLVYLSPYFKYTAVGCILFGSFWAGYFNARRGWACGGLTGISMGIMLLLASLLFLPGVPALGETVSTVFTTAILGGMAGVCGVNVIRARRKKQRAQKKAKSPKDVPLS